MKRILLFLTVLLLTGLAFAQVPDFSPEMIPFIFDNPLFMAAAMGGLIHMIRKAQPRIDGPVLVPVFGLVLGGVIGAAGQAATLLTVLPFADWTFPWGGAAYGAAASLLATIGFNIFEYASLLWNRNRVDPVTTTLALVATGQSPNAGAWIINTVKNLIPKNKVTAALEAVAPIIGEFGGALLTDELRATLQTRIHKTLRDAKLLTGKDMA